MNKEKELKYYGVVNASNTGLITELESKVNRLLTWTEIERHENQWLIPSNAKEIYVIVVMNGGSGNVVECIIPSIAFGRGNSYHDFGNAFQSAEIRIRNDGGGQYYITLETSEAYCNVYYR